MPDQSLTDHQKEILRNTLLETARKLLGIPYGYGAEWMDYSKIPSQLDCSELIEGIYVSNGLKMPDGSQAQFNFTIEQPVPHPCDLGFFGRGGNPKQVYHVGMLIDNHSVIEARGYDPSASFNTGSVILRPRARWEAYLPQFLGWRCHPKLI